MKYLLIISILVHFSSYGQDLLGFKTVAFDLGVKNYTIQSAPDTNKTWTTLTTINPLRQKDSNNYTSPISVVNIYYRAAATMINGYIYYTPAMLYSTNKNSVSITNTKVSTLWWTDKLQWTTLKEVNVSYYFIEYTSGSSWVKLAAVVAKGNGSYSYSNNRGWRKKPNYRLTPYFKDGTAGAIINF